MQSTDALEEIDGAGCTGDRAVIINDNQRVPVAVYRTIAALGQVLFKIFDEVLTEPRSLILEPHTVEQVIRGIIGTKRCGAIELATYRTEKGAVAKIGSPLFLSVQAL